MPTPTRILVVEDDPEIGRSLSASLGRMEYEVVAVVDRGEDVPHSVQQTRPDLILMDIALAGETDGIAAAEELARLADVPVVFLSAHADPRTLSGAGKALPFGYVHKPYTLAQLQGAIQMALYRSAVQRKLDHTERVFGAVRHIHRQMACLDDEQDLLQEICRTVVREQAYTCSWVVSLDAEGKVEHAAQAGLDTVFPTLLTRIRAGRFPPCMRRALEGEAGDPVSTPCLDCDLESDMPEGHRVSTRLACGSDTLAVWAVCLPTGLEPDSDVRALFREVADGLSLGLAGQRERGRRKASERALQRELAVSRALADASRALLTHSAEMEEVSEAVLACAQKLTGSPEGFVASVDPLTRTIVGHASSRAFRDSTAGGRPPRRVVIPIGPDGRYPGLRGHTFNTGAAFFTNRAESHEAARVSPGGEPVRNFLAAPASIDGEFAGLVALANADRNYTQEDLDAVQLLGDLYSLAIQRHRTDHRVRTLAALPDKDPRPVWRASTNGVVLYGNRAAREMLALWGDPAKDVLPPPLHRAILHAARNGQDTVGISVADRTFELTVVPEADGDCLNVYARETPGGNPADGGDETAGRLAAGVARSFSSDLTITQGYAAMLADRLRADASEQEWVAEILQATRRSAALVSDLLVIGHRQSLCRRVFEVGAALREMRPALERLVGGDVALRLPETDSRAWVHADHAAWQRAMTHLATNARDAMPTGGTLAFAIDLVPADSVPSHVGGPDGADRAVRLSVRDTGEGMDEETARRVFEPFFSTRDAATRAGLGLAMARGFVVQSGGFAEVDSPPGKGTTVRIYLPLAAPPSEEEPAGRDAEAPRRGHETILVAEDERAVLAFFVKALEPAGYTVLAAAGAQEAVELARQHGRIDLLVTDVVMPEINGFRLADRVHQIQPALPVLFVSGYAEASRVARVARGGRLRLLTKPFTEIELRLAVRQALDDDAAGE